MTPLPPAARVRRCAPSLREARRAPRRRLAIAVSSALVACLAVGSASAQTAGDEDHFTHGPILGRPSAHGMGVWARTNRPMAFAVRYGLDGGPLDKVSAAAETALDRDCTGFVLLEGLEPDTRYRYELVLPHAPGGTGKGGTFRTWPDGRGLASETNPRGLFDFSFEFACGNNQNRSASVGPALPTFETMRRRHGDRLAFAILNGDWLYESQRSFPPERWRAQVGIGEAETPRLVRIAPTIAGVWQNYKHFLEQGTNMARWHREVPSFFTFDDHEILNDVWGAGSPGLRDRRAVFRDIGVKAWFDYLGWSDPPLFPQGAHFGRAKLTAGSDVLVDEEADFRRLDLAQANNLHVHWGTPTAGVNDTALDGVGGVPNAGVYRIAEVLDAHRLRIEPAARGNGTDAYSIGRRAYSSFRLANCEFFLLDTRSQREMHDVRDPAKKGISMLGKEQREWLLDGLAKSPADFLFVVSSVNFMVPHVGGGMVREVNKDDAWTVFLDEREALIEAFDRLGKPVLVLTGDLHNSFAIRITDRVWEFASGPHNSQNHKAEDEGARPANGPFKYGPRGVDIRWSTYWRGDVPRALMQQPTYCVIRVNNVFDNPQKPGTRRLVAFPRPHVVVQYYDGRTGDLRYAESVHATVK